MKFKLKPLSYDLHLSPEEYSLLERSLALFTNSIDRLKLMKKEVTEQMVREGIVGEGEKITQTHFYALLKNIARELENSFSTSGVFTRNQIRNGLNSITIPNNPLANAFRDIHSASARPLRIDREQDNNAIIIEHHLDLIAYFKKLMAFEENALPAIGLCVKFCATLLGHQTYEELFAGIKDPTIVTKLINNDDFEFFQNLVITHHILRDLESRFSYTAADVVLDKFRNDIENLDQLKPYKYYTPGPLATINGIVALKGEALLASRQACYERFRSGSEHQRQLIQKLEDYECNLHTYGDELFKKAFDTVQTETKALMLKDAKTALLHNKHVQDTKALRNYFEKAPKLVNKYVVRTLQASIVLGLSLVGLKLLGLVSLWILVPSIIFSIFVGLKGLAAFIRPRFDTAKKIAATAAKRSDSNITSDPISLSDDTKRFNPDYERSSNQATVPLTDEVHAPQSVARPALRH